MPTPTDERIADLKDWLANIDAKLDLLLAYHQQRPDVGVVLLAAAIAATCGSDTFTTPQIEALSRSDLSTRARLRAAVGGRSAKALGKLLAQYAGQTMGAYRLERIGKSRPAVYRLSAFESQERRDRFNWGLNSIMKKAP